MLSGILRRMEVFMTLKHILLLALLASFGLLGSVFFFIPTTTKIIKINAF
jgi:hypothetical protein